MEVTKQQAKEITEEIKAAVEAIFKSHGLETPKASARYGISYSIKLEASVENLDENGVNLSSQEAMAYTQFHKAYDLNGGLLGTEFEVNGEKFTFIGLALSRNKYPIVARNSSGETVFFTRLVASKLNELVKS